MLLGSFNYNRMLEAAPRVAPVFFASYMVLVYIIFINMFIAIVNEYHTLAQREKRERLKVQQK